jgi:hypothetical protein
MVNHFISVSNKKEQFSCDLSACGVEGSDGVVGQGNCDDRLYGDMSYYMNNIIH